MFVCLIMHLRYHVLWLGHFNGDGILTVPVVSSLKFQTQIVAFPPNVAPHFAKFWNASLKSQFWNLTFVAFLEVSVLDVLVLVIMAYFSKSFCPSNTHTCLYTFFTHSGFSFRLKLNFSSSLTFPVVFILFIYSVQWFDIVLKDNCCLDMSKIANKIKNFSTIIIDFYLKYAPKTPWWKVITPSIISANFPSTSFEFFAVNSVSGYVMATVTKPAIWKFSAMM